MKYLLLIAALAFSGVAVSKSDLSGDNENFNVNNVGVKNISAYSEPRPTSLERFYVDLPTGYNFDYAGGDLIFSEELAGYHVRTNKQANHCIGSTAGYCRKAMVYFHQEYASHQFYLYVNEFGSFEDWIILFQDWVRIKPEDTNGNHPITTIKIFKENGKYYLGHFENSWQWDNSNYHPSDPYDLYHIHDDMEVERGRVEIVEGGHYSIDFAIQRSGYASLHVNGIHISSAYYQTKSPTEQHVYMIGAYWNHTSINATTTKYSIYSFGY